MLTHIQDLAKTIGEIQSPLNVDTRTIRTTMMTTPPKSNIATEATGSCTSRDSFTRPRRPDKANGIVSQGNEDGEHAGRRQLCGHAHAHGIHIPQAHHTPEPAKDSTSSSESALLGRDQGRCAPHLLLETRVRLFRPRVRQMGFERVTAERNHLKQKLRQLWDIPTPQLTEQRLLAKSP